jgi:hypothetical protein
MLETYSTVRMRRAEFLWGLVVRRNAIVTLPAETAHALTDTRRAQPVDAPRHWDYRPDPETRCAFIRGTDGQLRFHCSETV